MLAILMAEKMSGTSVKIIKNEVGCRDDTVPKTVEIKVQTLGANIWPGARGHAKALLHVRERTVYGRLQKQKPVAIRLKD